MIGKSFVKKPYMNLRLNNTVTDTGTGVNTPTNSGVTFTTDQFGRSNMAGNWDATSDRLSWASSVGNTIATKMNDELTIFFISKFINIDTLLRRVFNQDNANQTSFALTIADLAGFIDGFILLTSNDGNTLDVISINNQIDTNWNSWAVKYSDNTTGLDVNLYKNSSNVLSSNLVYAKENSSAEMRLGARANGNIDGAFGDLNNFRIYDVALSDGQLKILNNEKGRITI